MSQPHDGLLGSEPHTQGIEGDRKRQPPKNLPDAMIKALRPKQWVKNVLVIAAPAAAGSAALLSGRTIADVAIAFLVFCLAASSIYLVNDARDVEADRAHPTKRFRPIAAGVLPVDVERDPGSRALTARLADNELDVGIVYRTDVASSHGWVSQAEVNRHDRELAAAAGTTRYTLARVPGGEDGPDAEAERAAAEKFMELVTSDRGRRAFENAGLAPVTQ